MFETGILYIKEGMEDTIVKQNLRYFHQFMSCSGVSIISTVRYAVKASNFGIIQYV